MRQIAIAGSYRQLGRAYGEMIASQKLNWWWKTPGANKLALAKACEVEIAKHAPGFLEELREIAKACDAPYDTVLANMTVAYFVENPSCNVVAVSASQSANGRTIMARNHDWLDADIDWITCFRTAPADSLKSLGFGFTDPGRYDGINAAGLAIGGSSIPFYQGKLQPGLRMNVVMRWVLDTCEDVPSAVAYMKSIPHQEGIAYLIADASGRIARVEAAPEGVDVQLTCDGMLATVNTFQSEAMASHDRVPDGDTIHAYLSRIQAWYEANAGSVSAKSVMEFCSDHESGICDHGGYVDEPCGTIYSWVAELGTDELQLAFGRPCESAYERYALDVPVQS